jgi:hypothetical protein
VPAATGSAPAGTAEGLSPRSAAVSFSAASKSRRGGSPTQGSTPSGSPSSPLSLEQQVQMLRAEVALAEAERIEMAKILRSEREMHAQCQNERDEARIQYRSTEALGMALVKTIDQLKAEKAAIFAQLVSLQAGSRRATLDEIAESVREKYDERHEGDGMEND